MKIFALSLSNFRLVFLSIFLVGFFSSSSISAEESTHDHSDGYKIYRLGVLPSGKKLTAIVAGDIAVSGKQFSCANCHGRSGMGTIEGNYIVPPIAGQLLFNDSTQPIRPAYDETSLAKLLRSGTNPNGKLVDQLMPRFILSDSEISDLTRYLRGLSMQKAPGIDDEVIRLATVITEDTDPKTSQAVIQVLQTYVEEKNRQTRLEGRRPNRGKKAELRSASLFRKWTLDIWTLKGPTSNWAAQLEDYYNSRPVFALLGGVTTGSWDPIGKFCESNAIPCMFPSTDLAEAGEDDFYTYHFSRGLELEADLIATQIVKSPVDKVIQVYCSDLASKAAKRLNFQLSSHRITTEIITFNCDKPDVDTLARKLNLIRKVPAVLWINRDILDRLIKDISTEKIYLSSTILSRQLNSITAASSSKITVAHPFLLPGESDSAMRRFRLWAKLRKIKITEPRYQAEAFFACLALKDALTHVRRFRVRDYFLEVLDHSQGLELYLPIYPRATLGPGQRFISKGGYILPIIAGEPDIKNAIWVIP